MFYYRSSTTFDTWGAWTHVAATGFVMPTGDNQMHQVYVPAAELAANGYGYCRLAVAETVNDPVDACVLIAVIQQRYQQTTTTMLT